MLAALLLVPAAAGARPITVAQQGAADFPSLVDALRAAKPGDQITVLDVGRAGLELVRDAEGLVVARAVAGGAAAKAGVQAGDRLLAVDGQDVSALDARAASARIGGKPGTAVKLKLSRGGADPFEASVTRAPLTYTFTAEEPRHEIARKLGDPKAALALAQLDAERVRDARRYLAQAYFDGASGAPRDPGRAAALAKTCADDDARCAVVLGVLLREGSGVPRDLKESANRLRQADMAGEPWGSYQLALSFQQGLGVPKDERKARVLYEKAAKAGVAEAAAQLGVLKAGAVEPAR
jgi:TPR repeat protein